ncbi:MAG: hypothetical protein V1701_11560 [Planctomycetota bacterium]
MKKYLIIILGLLILVAIIIYLLANKVPPDHTPHSVEPHIVYKYSYAYSQIPPETKPIIYEYHLWLEIGEAWIKDYELLEIKGYTSSSSVIPSKDGIQNNGVLMTKTISKTIDLTKSIPTITETNTTKILLTRIGPDWNEVYNYDTMRYVHLQSGFKLTGQKNNISLTLTLRNGKTNQTKDLTLPVYMY